MIRENFLTKFDKALRHSVFFNKLAKSGFLWKIPRLIFSPRFYGRYLLWKFHLIPRFSRRVKLFWGRSFWADVNDDDIIILYLFGALVYSNAESKLTKYLIKNLKENDVFYDLGANYGFYTYLALEFCKEVHSFEPIPNVFQTIENNLKNEKKAILNNVAVSDKNGSTTIYISRSSGVSTISEKFSKDRTDVVPGSYSKKLEVKTTTLDKYLGSNLMPTFIKMDVEGAESLVIDGATNLLKNNHPVISLEVCRLDNGGELSMVAVEKLRALGYRSYAIKDDGNLIKDDGNLSETMDSAFDNFIFMKENVI